MRRLIPLLTAALVLVTLASATTGTSSAAFTSVSSSAASVTAAVDWTPPTVAITLPEHVAGPVTLTVDAADGETGVREVVVEVRRPGAATGWAVLGTRTSPPWTFAWDTTPLGDADHELRATATDGVGLSTTTAPVRTTVMNTVTVTLAAPDPLVRGTVPLTADVAGLGITGVRFESAAAGTEQWQPLAPATTTPYRAEVDTRSLRDGRYDLRAVTTGRVAQASPVVGGVVVDNTAPTASLTAADGPLRGTVQLTAAAADANGVAGVTLQGTPAGTGAYTDLDVATTAPYRFALDTARLREGRYDLRVVVRDAVGNEAVSAVVTRVVDNHRPHGVDVQAHDGGGTPGLVERGDVLAFTFGEEVALGSIAPGWTGAPTAVRVRLRNGGLLQGDDDVLEVLGTVALGAVRTGADHVGLLQTRTFAATMTATTATAEDGTLRSVVRIELGQQELSLLPGRTTGPATLVWTPSAAITDLAGTPVTTGAVVESGPLDVDF